MDKNPVMLVSLGYVHCEKCGGPLETVHTTRFGWLRLVPKDVLETLDAWGDIVNGAFEGDPPGDAVALRDAIDAELARREREG